MFRSRRAFERLVEEALRELPEAFRPYLGELPVVVDFLFVARGR